MRTFSADGQVLDHRHDALAERRPRAGCRGTRPRWPGARASPCSIASARGGDVLPAGRSARAAGRCGRARAPACSSSARSSSDPRRRPSRRTGCSAGQVAAVARASSSTSASIGAAAATRSRRRSRRRLLDGGHDLVAQEPVGVVEARRAAASIDRWRRDPRQRGRDVAADPDVLVPVAQEVRERLEHALAVARRARRAPRRLSTRSPQQRDERRQEQRVGLRPSCPALLHRLARDVEVGVEHQGHEQRPEARVADPAEGGRHLAPAPPRPRGCRRRAAAARPPPRPTSSSRELPASATAAVAATRGSRVARGTAASASARPLAADRRQRRTAAARTSASPSFEHPLDGRAAQRSRSSGRRRFEREQRARAHPRGRRGAAAAA